MLLNWNTIDACFLTPQVHIRTSFQFFLMCIFAFILVLSLEVLRRVQRSFDRHLRRKNAFLTEMEYVPPMEDTTERFLKPSTPIAFDFLKRKRLFVVFLEQMLRGMLYGCQFSVSYCIMLLFMYSNGVSSLHLKHVLQINYLQDMSLLRFYLELW